MAHIILNTGDLVLVDADDYPLLSRYEWQRAGNAGYAVTTMQTLNDRNVTIYMHKLIMGGFSIIDHINLDPLDNRKENLRRATRNENEWNKSKQRTAKGKPCTSKYKGVSLCNGKWRSQIKRKGVHYSLGEFSNELDAARAYNKKAKELSGKFLWLNPLPDIKQQS